MRTCEGSATQALDPTSCGSFDFARRLASLRMTLACEGSATQALDATSCGSFDFARRLASLRMTLRLGGPETFGTHPSGLEDLHAVVAAIGHVHRAVGVDRDGLWKFHLPDAAALAA